MTNLNLYRSIKPYSVFLKYCGFFPVTLSSVNSISIQHKTTPGDFVIFLATLIFYSVLGISSLQGHSFYSNADSKIVLVGFSTIRTLNHGLVFLRPILCFIHRNRMVKILKNISFVDQQVI